MKRLLHLVLVAAAVSAACRSKTTGQTQHPLVGVTLLTQTQDFYKDLEQGLREEAAARGLELTITSCEMDPAKQAAQIDDFIAQKVVAIVAAPCDSASIGPSLDAAKRAGIPVFTADIAARSGSVVAHVASDNVQGGRLAGEAMARFTGGKGKIVIIDHPVVASVQDRVRGFEEELKKHPEMTIVARPSSDGQRAKAMAVMEDMLQAHPDLAGVFGINDDSALGALSVVRAAGRQNVVIVGYDATAPAQQAIKEGSALKADVAQSPKKIGRTAIEMVSRHLHGETVPALVPVEVALVDQKSLTTP